MKLKYFLLLPLLFLIFEIASAFSLYFPLQAIRRYFESQKQKPDVEARSQEEIDSKSLKNRRAVRRHKVSTYDFSK